jgi:tetratricopeptide (TPR) repeat protein
LRRNAIAVISLTLTFLLSTHAAAAPESWFEIKSPHFTVWATANDGNTRTLVWQLEQVRSALATLWPWAKVDLPKPIVVLAVKDENGIRALAPEFWERKGGVRPVSVWVSGADRDYMVIRTDIKGDDTDTLNPYRSTYFSYVHLILQSSFGRSMPLWFSRGLAEVLSNTLVRKNEIYLGSLIPGHLNELRQQQLLPLKALVAVTRTSPEYTQGDRLGRFDAESWAFVHYLMFAQGGANRPRINGFADRIRAGMNADTALAEAIGRPEAFEADFQNYIKRSLFTYQKTAADAKIAREQFGARPIPPGEAAAGRAVFHVAMGRPAEAQASIKEARGANPNEPDAFLAEGLQFDRDQKSDEARAAYARAVDLGSTNAYAFYRAAVMNWPRPDDATLAQMEKQLTQATTLNPSFAYAYANLAEVRALLKQSPAAIVPMLARAVQLEPFDPWHRLTAARVLIRLGNPDEAKKAAEAALALADDDRERQEAQRVLADIQRRRGPG